MSVRSTAVPFHHELIVERLNRRAIADKKAVGNQGSGASMTPDIFLVGVSEPASLRLNAGEVIVDMPAKKSPASEWDAGQQIGWLRPTKGAL